MEYLVLLGIAVVIVGFALRLDSILIVFLAAIVTALLGNLGIDGFLTTLGESFVSNRSVALFIIILLVTGTLERNGLKQAAAALIGKAKKPEMVTYRVLRELKAKPRDVLVFLREVHVAHTAHR